MNLRIPTNKQLLFILAAFLILVGPMALNYNFYYPDEVHYTDAAITMIQNGDFFTPLQGNGELRFNKPILTYWVVLLGFKMFGISAFAARFFFLLAGAGSLIFIYRTAQLLYEENQQTIVSTFIAITNLTFVLSSMRAIPDMLLCLFLSMSFLGFAGLLKFGNNAQRRYHWLFYLGLALAFEVKGLPAIIFGASSILFLLIQPWNRLKIKTLLHWPSLLTGIIIALSWFALMFVFYRNEFMQSFYDDQIGKRVITNPLTISRNIGIGLLLITSLSLPWLTFISKKSYKTHAFKGAFSAFVIIEVMLLIIISGFVYKFYDRYLLPLVPIWSVWLGRLIADKIQGSILKIWVIISIVAHVILIVFITTITIAHFEGFAQLLWLISGVCIVCILSFKLYQTKKLQWFSLLLLSFIFNVSIATHIISFPDEGMQIKKVLADHIGDYDGDIGFLGMPQIASKLRVASEGKYKPINLDELYAEYESENYKVMIVSEKNMKLFPSGTFNVIGQSVSWKSSSSKELIYSLWTGSYKEKLSVVGKKYYVLKRI